MSKRTSDALAAGLHFNLLAPSRYLGVSDACHQTPASAPGRARPSSAEAPADTSEADQRRARTRRSCFRGCACVRTRDAWDDAFMNWSRARASFAVGASLRMRARPSDVSPRLCTTCRGAVYARSHLAMFLAIEHTALHCVVGEQVAIKKITNAFEDHIDCKRMLREMRLLQHFDHENVLALRVGALTTRR